MAVTKRRDAEMLSNILYNIDSISLTLVVLPFHEPIGRSARASQRYTLLESQHLLQRQGCDIVHQTRWSDRQPTHTQ
jgi:hypothetical protein